MISQQSNADDSPAAFAAYAAALRAGLVRFDLRLIELKLLLVLEGETYGAGRVQGNVNYRKLAEWAGLMWRDGRPDKLWPYWRELVAIGAVDWNAAQGTYELRPPSAAMPWSRDRRVAVPDRSLTSLYNEDLRSGELALRLERPLDEALSSVARESAAAQPRVVPVPPTAKERPPVDLSAGGSICPGQTALEWHRDIRRTHPASEWPRFQAEFEKRLAADLSPEGMAKLSAAMVEKSAMSEIAEKPNVLAAAEKSPLSRARGTSLELSTEARLAVGDVAEKSAEARKWVREIDACGHLAQENCRRQWEELCNRNPGYVLRELKPALERKLKKEHVYDALAFVARKGREDRQLRRV